MLSLLILCFAAAATDIRPLISLISFGDAVFPGCDACLRNTVEAAFQDQNVNVSVNFAVAIFDDAWEATRIIARLPDTTIAVFGGSRTSYEYALPTTIRSIPLFSFSPDSRAFLASPQFHFDLTTVCEQSIQMAANFVKSQGWHRVGLIMVREAVAYLSVIDWNAYFVAAGVSIDYADVSSLTCNDNGRVDIFQKILAQMKQRDIRVVVAYLMVTQQNTFVQAVQAMGLTQYFIPIAVSGWQPMPGSDLAGLLLVSMEGQLASSAFAQRFPGCLGAYAYLYDSGSAVARAVRTLNDRGLAINGTSVRDLVQQSNFEGMSGRVMFNSVGQGMGRLYMLQYTQQQQYRVVGEYDAARSSSWTNLSLSWHMYAGGVRPEDRLSLFIAISPTVHIIGVVMVVVAIVFVVATACILFYNRDAEHIKSRTPIVLYQLSVGSIMMLVAVFFDNNALGSVTCTVPVALVSVGFMLVFSSIIVRVWRVMKIFNLEKLKVVRITTFELFFWTGVCAAWELFINLMWFYVDPPTLTTGASKTRADALIQTCTGNNRTLWITLQTMPKVLVLSYGVYIAWQCRNIANSNFNESTEVTNATFITVVLSAVAFIAVFTIKESPDTVYLVYVLIIALVNMLLPCILFGMSQILQPLVSPHHVSTMAAPGAAYNDGRKSSMTVAMHAFSQHALEAGK